MPRKVLLIHGAATTPRIWRRVVDYLTDLDVHVPLRASTGQLDLEVKALRPLAQGAIVVGVSGGATLGLELLARLDAVPAAILHEPAVGSLVPGLLDRVAEAFASGGVEGFGTTLYGPSWSMAEVPADIAAVARDLAMFREFEPKAPSASTGRVIVTVGELSPRVRHDAARLLAASFGYAVQIIPGCGHAVHLDQPEYFADLIRQVAQDTQR